MYGDLIMETGNRFLNEYFYKYNSDWDLTHSYNIRLEISKMVHEISLCDFSFYHTSDIFNLYEQYIERDVECKFNKIDSYGVALVPILPYSDGCKNVNTTIFNGKLWTDCNEKEKL